MTNLTNVTTIKNIIETSWDNRSEISTSTEGSIRDTVNDIINLVDSGKLRVATKNANGDWEVNEWVKKAILLSFRLNDMEMIDGAPSSRDLPSCWYDKVESKFLGKSKEDFANMGFRAVPGSIVRKGSYIAKNVVLMPSFVNIGAFVDEGTMVDTWATVGSCAQIGKNCHISGGVGIGGVLEPLQANPVIIEDNCFIGARSEIAEGVIVGEGSVISMGVYLGMSTRIIDRETGEVSYGRVPKGSVVVAGSMPSSSGDKYAINPNLYAAIIVKKVDEKTRAKTEINELLRA